MLWINCLFVLLPSLLCFIQGWTKFYEFSLSDLRAGFEIIDRLFEGRGAANNHYNAVKGSAVLCSPYGNEKWNLWVLWSITSLIYSTPDKHDLHNSAFAFIFEYLPFVVSPCLSLRMFVCTILLFCVLSLHMFVAFFVSVCISICQGGKAFQWEFVHGLLESAIYGGRIDNPSDLRILRSYLEQFFSAHLFSSSLSAGQRKSRGGTRFFPPQISLPNSCSILVGCQGWRSGVTCAFAKYAFKHVYSCRRSWCLKGSWRWSRTEFLLQWK